MRKKDVYIADDGTEFGDKDACINYEVTRLGEEQAMYSNLPIDQQYKIVRDAFEDALSNRSLSDSYLIEHGSDCRSGGIGGNITAEYSYGIVHLRDDAVEVLLKYIEFLNGANV